MCEHGVMYSTMFLFFSLYARPVITQRIEWFRVSSLCLLCVFFVCLRTCKVIWSCFRSSPTLNIPMKLGALVSSLFITTHTGACFESITLHSSLMIPEHNILKRERARGGGKGWQGRWGVAMNVCVMDMVNKDACIHLSSTTKFLPRLLMNPTAHTHAYTHTQSG